MDNLSLKHKLKKYKTEQKLIKLFKNTPQSFSEFHKRTLKKLIECDIKITIDSNKYIMLNGEWTIGYIDFKNAIIPLESNFNEFNEMLCRLYHKEIDEMNRKLHEQKI